MIPFLAPLLLKLSPVGAVLKRIPRGIWIALAVVAILLLGTCAHKRAVTKAHDAAYAQGKADEGARIVKKAREIERKMNEASAKISTALKDRNNEENRAIAGRADDLRLRGPGKAACPGHPSISHASGGSVAAGGLPDAAGPEMLAGDSAAVPWPWLVNRAEQCDLNRAEVLSWREWHRQQSEAWAKIGGDR